MAIPVEARYVPKSISYERRDGGVRIRVKATSPGNLLRAAALIIGAFIVPPFFLFMSFGTAAIVFLAMIGGGLYLLFGASPPMLISRDGVEVSGLLYRAQDAAFFTDSADDAAIPSYFSAVKLNQLGLRHLQHADALHPAGGRGGEGRAILDPDSQGANRAIERRARTQNPAS
jgi:hypothetical protein